MKIVILSLLIAIAFALDVSIDLVSQSPLTISFTVSNPGTTDETFLQWGTPFEGIWDDMFEIRDEDFNIVTYAGILMRRGEVPIDSEFVTIAAGESKSVIVDLGSNYEFKTTGKYMVRVNLPQYSQLTYENNEKQVEVFQLETVPERKPVGAPQAWTNCNSNQISITNAAISSSITAASRSVSCLNTGCDTLYSTWFGTYTDSNWNHVSNIFRQVHARLNNYEFNGYCNAPQCNANTYGYVYPSDTTFTVHLCALFWSIPNERENTIIHEMSHFNSLGRTQDYTYGENNCRNLARTNPNNACRNADNICYFSYYV
jgi:peptidyl-Lys metalloendopeptidase